MRVLPLGGEVPREEGLATPSSVLAWEIPWTEESGGLQSLGSQRVRQDSKQLSTRDTYCLEVESVARC